MHQFNCLCRWAIRWSSNPGETKKDVDDIQRQSVEIFAAGDAPPPYFFSKSYGICYGGECGFYIDKRVQKVYTLVSSKMHSKGASYAENS